MSHTLHLVYTDPDGNVVTNDVAIEEPPFSDRSNDLFGMLMERHRRREWLVRMGGSLAYGIADKIDGHRK